MLCTQCTRWLALAGVLVATWSILYGVWRPLCIPVVLVQSGHTVHDGSPKRVLKNAGAYRQTETTSNPDMFLFCIV